MFHKHKHEMVEPAHVQLPEHCKQCRFIFCQSTNQLINLLDKSIEEIPTSLTKHDLNLTIDETTLWQMVFGLEKMEIQECVIKLKAALSLSCPADIAMTERTARTAVCTVCKVSICSPHQESCSSNYMCVCCMY